MERAEAIIALELNDKYSMEELKTAFRNQANKWHPDHNLSNREFAENKMKQINSAYEMLKNEFLATSGYIGLNKDYDKFAYKINTLFWHILEYKDENDSPLYEIYKWAYQQYCYIKYEALSKTYLSDYDLEYELVIAKISNVYENTCIKMKNYLYSIIPNNYRTIKIIDRLQETESSSKNIVDYNVGTLYNLYSECEKDIKKELIVSMEKEEKEKLLNKYFVLIEEKCINMFREEIELLGDSDPTIIALGGKSFEILTKNLGGEYRIAKVLHYSCYKSKKKYREEVEKVLKRCK